MPTRAESGGASYLVPSGYGEAELIEKRSRFIGRVWPAETEEEALAYLARTRERHRDASHNVYAYIIRDGGFMRYSDDGEPGGSSGMPTLNVFRSAGIYNFCCVVTRYFGGTLLGTGGLARAYSAAAKLALDVAGISEMALWRPYRLMCSYSQYNQLARLLEESDAARIEAEFGERVVVSAMLRAETADDFDAKLLERFAATVEADAEPEIFMAVSSEKNIENK